MSFSNVTCEEYRFRFFLFACRRKFIHDREHLAQSRFFFVNHPWPSHSGRHSGWNFIFPGDLVVETLSTIQPLSTTQKTPPIASGLSENYTELMVSTSPFYRFGISVQSTVSYCCCLVISWSSVGCCRYFLKIKPKTSACGKTPQKLAKSTKSE